MGNYKLYFVVISNGFFHFEKKKFRLVAHFGYNILADAMTLHSHAATHSGAPG